MFERYIDNSDKNKQKLNSFLELLDGYIKTDEENNSIKKQLISLSSQEISHIFELAKDNPELQIEIWRVLPDEIVDNPENYQLFEAVLDNKFGEYLQKIDKKELVKLLNSSRTESRSNG